MAAQDCRVLLVAVETVVRDANAITDTQAVRRVLQEARGAAVAELDGDAIGLVAAALLDLVAHDGSADGAGCGRGGVASTAPDLVAEHAAHDAADHRAGAARAAALVHDVDGDHAAVVGIRDIAVVGGRGRVARLGV